MTGNDLIALTPWVIFGVGLAIIWIRLHWPRRRQRRPPPETATRRQHRQAKRGDGSEDPPSTCGQAMSHSQRGAR